jgi:hypothetical protein
MGAMISAIYHSILHLLHIKILFTQIKAGPETTTSIKREARRLKVAYNSNWAAYEPLEQFVVDVANVKVFVGEADFIDVNDRYLYMVTDLEPARNSVRWCYIEPF